MINRVMLPVVISGLIATFFVLEITGRFPAFLAVGCMATLWLSWRRLGPLAALKGSMMLTSWEKWFERSVTLLWVTLALLFALRVIAGIALVG